MKRALIAYLILPVLFLLVPDGRLSAADNDLKIAMVLWRGETPAEMGFKKKLEQLGYSVQYTVMNAGQDKQVLGRIVRKDLKARAQDFDYVYTFGTTVSKAVHTILGDAVPHIFNIVAAPAKAGLVKSMQSSGGNITGVSNGIPISLQIETVAKVLQFKRLGLIFNPREKNSMLIREALREISDKAGFELIDIKTPPTLSALKKNLVKLKDRSIVVDVVYLPYESFAVSNAALIGKELKNAKIKTIGALKKFIDGGALMGVVPDYPGLGAAAAVIVDRHRKGEKLENIPVQSPREATLVINRTTSRALQIEISEQVANSASFVD